jgi:hypothetical protein
MRISEKRRSGAAAAVAAESAVEALGRRPGHCKGDVMRHPRVIDRLSVARQRVTAVIRASMQAQGSLCDGLPNHPWFS